MLLWYNDIFFCDPRQWIFPCDDGDNKRSEMTSQQTLEEKVLFQKTVTVTGTKVFVHVS